ncbi:MAG: MFS transporter, partial [Planctomycetaceae bacterium]
SLFLIPGLYWWLSNNLNTAGSLGTFQVAVFLAGVLVVGQMSFWGNYIPLVFPVHLRGTGESFAANIGGRVIGTAAAFITLTLSASTPPKPEKIALMCAIVAGCYAVVGTVLTFVLPEPKHQDE